MAGIIFTPACSNIDDKLDNEEEIINSPTPSADNENNETEESSAAPSVNTNISENNGNRKNDNNSVKVITNEKKLDGFNSISEEEINELLRLIENIDISDEINPEADPGFDQIEIPDE